MDRPTEGRAGDLMDGRRWQLANVGGLARGYKSHCLFDIMVYGQRVSSTVGAVRGHYVTSKTSPKTMKQLV